MRIDESTTRPILLVVAAALISTATPDAIPRVLLAERPQGKRLAGYWEYPGGKVDSGESPETALVRELREELDIVVDESALKPLMFASHAESKFHLLMPLYGIVNAWKGEPQGAENQQIAWATAEELDTYKLPAADVVLLEPVKHALRAARAATEMGT
eukprot:6207094-Pleurochrysis_carterae.AAC.3